jgi:hypothetical protein
MDAVKKIVATDARRLKLEALTTLQQIAEGNVDIKYAPIARAQLCEANREIRKQEKRDRNSMGPINRQTVDTARSKLSTQNVKSGGVVDGLPVIVNKPHNVDRNQQLANSPLERAAGHWELRSVPGRFPPVQRRVWVPDRHTEKSNP